MSYNGTVHCGWCGSKGHNRLSCPLRKEAAINDPNGYTARAMAREKQHRKRAIESRVCSYCKKPGHNRRGCTVLKRDKSTLSKCITNYRKRLLSCMRESGLGVGATLSVPHGATRQIHMVTGFGWDSVDFTMADPRQSSHWHRGFVKTTIANSGGSDREYHRPGCKANVAFEKLGFVLGEEAMVVPEQVSNWDKSPYRVVAASLVHGSVKGLNPPENWLDEKSLDDSHDMNYFWEKWNIKPRKGSCDFDKRRREQWWSDPYNHLEGHPVGLNKNFKKYISDDEVETWTL